MWQSARRTGVISRVLSPAVRAVGDHLSGVRITPDLERPTRDSGGTGGPSSPIWPCSGWGLPCDPCCQRPGALLPHPFTLACIPRLGEPSAVCSLRHFPSPRGARALPGILPCGARTFLRPASPGASAGDPSARPPGRVTKLQPPRRAGPAPGAESSRTGCPRDWLTPGPKPAEYRDLYGKHLFTEFM